MKRQHKDWQSGPKDFALLNLTSYIGCVDALDGFKKIWIFFENLKKNVFFIQISKNY